MTNLLLSMLKLFTNFPHPEFGSVLRKKEDGRYMLTFASVRIVELPAENMVKAGWKQ